eukprot:g5374.t1
MKFVLLLFLSFRFSVASFPGFNLFLRFCNTSKLWLIDKPNADLSKDPKFSGIHSHKWTWNLASTSQTAKVTSSSSSTKVIHFGESDSVLLQGSTALKLSDGYGRFRYWEASVPQSYLNGPVDITFGIVQDQPLLTTSSKIATALQDKRHAFAKPIFPEQILKRASKARETSLKSYEKSEESEEEKYEDEPVQVKDDVRPPPARAWSINGDGTWTIDGVSVIAQTGHLPRRRQTGWWNRLERWGSYGKFSSEGINSPNTILPGDTLGFLLDFGRGKQEEIEGSIAVAPTFSIWNKRANETLVMSLDSFSRYQQNSNFQVPNFISQFEIFEIEGKSFDFELAAFGPGLPLNTLRSDVALAVPFDACTPLTSPMDTMKKPFDEEEEWITCIGSTGICLPVHPHGKSTGVRGKIVFVRRGKCDFLDKVRNLQDAGAVAVVVGNFIPNKKNNEWKETKFVEKSKVQKVSKQLNVHTIKGDGYSYIPPIMITDNLYGNEHDKSIIYQEEENLKKEKEFSISFDDTELILMSSGGRPADDIKIPSLFLSSRDFQIALRFINNLSKKTEHRVRAVLRGELHLQGMKGQHFTSSGVVPFVKFGQAEVVLKDVNEKIDSIPKGMPNHQSKGDACWPLPIRPLFGNQQKLNSSLHQGWEKRLVKFVLSCKNGSNLK